MTSRVMVALRIAAPPSRVFTGFTAEIGQSWRPHGLFALNSRGDGRLAIEAGVGGRSIESYPEGVRRIRSPDAVIGRHRRPRRRGHQFRRRGPS